MVSSKVYVKYISSHPVNTLILILVFIYILSFKISLVSFCIFSLTKKGEMGKVVGVV